MLFLAHILAAYVVLAAPWLSWVGYQRARKRIAARVPDAKVRLYRALVGEQFITTGVVLVLWYSGRFSATSLGLVVPRSWGWNAVALVVVVAALAWSSLRLRPKAEKIRRSVQDGIGALIPDSRPERFWWGAVSAGAGISEELIYRGFLLYYCTLYLPHLNTSERVLLTSLVFGFGHLYQGWRGAVAAGILGLVLAGMYLITGSLLLPVVIHAATDARVLLIFPPGASPKTLVQGNA
ncbi:MAG: CPBP family intramembrane metalloprotease [Acidobacteriia bacterium]|nr:CPBP family intramembrane metalloprotease [Terriglobia bacterium]